MQFSTTPPSKSVLPPIQPQQRPEGLVLTEQVGSGCQFAFIGFFALAWNAIAWPVALTFWFSSRRGSGSFPDLILFFVLLFPLIGLVLIGLAVRQLLIASAFGRAELVVSTWPLRMGQEAQVTFRRAMRGGQQVDQVEARLVCTEVATYSAGTDTRTVRERIWDEPLPQTPMLPGMASVEASWRVRIPETGPQSFSVYRNSVVWSVDVVLRAPNFPDASSSFTLVVLPEVLL